MNLPSITVRALIILFCRESKKESVVTITPALCVQRYQSYLINTNEVIFPAAPVTSRRIEFEPWIRRRERKIDSEET